MTKGTEEEGNWGETEEIETKNKEQEEDGGRRRENVRRR